MKKFTFYSGNILKILQYLQAFEDSEFFQMEEEINRETQRDELSKLVSEKGRRLLARQLAIEKVRSQNKISFGKNTKEIQSLEKKRQELLTELRKVRTNPIT